VQIQVYYITVYVIWQFKEAGLMPFTLWINLIQSGQVRLSTRGCLAVLFNLEHQKQFWMYKANIKYKMTI
jgi:hypothetical protein